jgi:hypothetical protein
MDGEQLHRLGRRLIELSALVTDAPGDMALTLGEAAVLEDVIRHPDSSISAVHRRTGFAQTHVSESVIRLKRYGLLATAGELPHGRLASAWRSSTRVRATDEALKTIRRRTSRRVDEVVMRAVADPCRAGRAISLMDELAEILL